jgi:hypothetical protein
MSAARPTAEALAHEMLEASELGPLLVRAANEWLIPRAPAAKRALADAALAVVRERFEERMPDLVERLVPVCVARFSARELAELTAFFRTAAGQRWQRRELELSTKQTHDRGAAGKSAARRASRDTSAYSLARQLVVATHSPPPGIDSATMAEIDRVRAPFLGLWREVLVRKYAEHFSRDELIQLIAFHTSPLGRRWVREQPLQTPEGQREWHVWTVRVVSEVRTVLRERGILPP